MFSLFIFNVTIAKIEFKSFSIFLFVSYVLCFSIPLFWPIFGWVFCSILSYMSCTDFFMFKFVILEIKKHPLLISNYIQILTYCLINNVRTLQLYNSKCTYLRPVVIVPQVRHFLQFLKFIFHFVLKFGQFILTGSQVH